MGWSLGFDPNWNRDIGYGVPAVCDHPRCDEAIDRGLSHVCGGEPYGGDRGCGLFFCSTHLRHDTGRPLCTRCYHRKPAYTPRPDTREWLEWKLTDPSWAEWRVSEPEAVRRIEAELKALPAPSLSREEAGTCR